MRGFSWFGSGLAWAGMLLLAGCDGSVVETVPVHSLEVSPDAFTLMEGEEVTVQVSLKGPAGEALQGRAIEWTVMDERVAEVPSSGVVRGLSPGQTELRVESEGVASVAAVTVIEGPRIGLDSPSVTFSGRAGRTTPLQTSFGVSNVGNGTLTDLSAEVVEVIDGGGVGATEWLEAELSSPTAPAQLTLRARLQDLSAGEYEGAVVVRSPVAANSPDTVRVSLTVDAVPPQIGLSPSNVAFSANTGSREPASQVVRVENIGAGVLDDLEIYWVYTGGPASGWLDAELEGTEAPSAVTLEARARHLLPGTYTAVVRVSSPNASPGEREIDVTFNVSALAGARRGATDVRQPEARGIDGIPTHGTRE